MLLQTSPWPVARIAAECGYDCASRFAVSFRQRYGLSPSALRATLPAAFTWGMCATIPSAM
jgi:transcriptional regulator GlxA family with amidase domain